VKFSWTVTRHLCSSDGTLLHKDWTNFIMAHHISTCSLQQSASKRYFWSLKFSNS